MSDETMSHAAEQLSARPDHVPENLVLTVDIFQAGMGTAHPHAAMAKLHQRGGTLYNIAGMNPHGRMGYWLPTNADDVRSILLKPELFSSQGVAGFSALMGESWDLIPAELDPPDHTVYRQFLNQMFSPSAVAAMEVRIRAHAVALIEKVLPLNGCEFVESFSKPFPILIFLSMMGLPLDRFDDILAWGHDLHGGTSMAQRASGAIAIGAFLREEIGKARISPGNEILSKIVHGEINGRALTDTEILAMVYLLFTGGIHTVTASLGFQFDHLARNPDAQARLRADSTAIPNALEELLRAYAVVNSFRRVMADTEIAGVFMKAGDWILTPLPLANYDPESFSNPLEIDLARPRSRHLAFSNGVHFCLGAHLARREMTIALQEWLVRAPPFRVLPEETIATNGPLLSFDRLVLAWG